MSYTNLKETNKEKFSYDNSKQRISDTFLKN